MLMCEQISPTVQLTQAKALTGRSTPRCRPRDRGAVRQDDDRTVSMQFKSPVLVVGAGALGQFILQSQMLAPNTGRRLLVLLMAQGGVRVRRPRGRCGCVHIMDIGFLYRRTFSP